MSRTAKEFVNMAAAFIGCRESDGTHKPIIDIYNKHKPLARGYAVKYTDAWCATFISAISIKLGYTDIIPTECGCEQMINLFKNLGVWVENENRTPNVGDIIFYDWGDSGLGDNKGYSDHVGVVETVTKTNITVIEGNYSDSVKRRTIAINSRYIRGYAVPKYDVETNVYFKKYTGKTVSIVDALKAIGSNPTFTYRKKIAAKNGIKNYSGTAAQNTTMLILLKQGKLLKP